MPIGDTITNASDSILIGQRRVGAGRSTFVIAEAGVNHDGDLDRALRLVDAAAEAGADAVKFQMFCATELVTAEAPMAAYQRKNGSGLSKPAAPSASDAARTAELGKASEVTQRTMLAKLELSVTAFARIKRHCDERSVQFLASPFSPAALAQLVELRPTAIKIASTDLTNTPLVAGAAETGLPIILSVGASTADEIDAAVQVVRPHPLVLLHCVSCYPTPIEAINLRAISALAARFGVPAGLSDHTTSTEVGAWAVAAGACVLEKHFTLDRSAAGPDHAMSMAPEELQAYIVRVREVESAMGNGRIGMTDREVEVRTVAGRSVVAVRDVPAGTVLTADMLTLKRPGTGLSPSTLDALVGRTVTSPLAADAMLSWEIVR